jgi:MFS family permease
MTLPAILLLDKIGRRPTLIIGAFCMMSLLFISGSIQAAYGEPNNTPGSPTTWHLVGKPVQGRVVVAVSYLFVAVFATSWGPVSWTYPAEIFPSKVIALSQSQKVHVLGEADKCRSVPKRILLQLQAAGLGIAPLLLQYLPYCTVSLGKCTSSSAHSMELHVSTCFSWLERQQA